MNTDPPHLVRSRLGFTVLELLGVVIVSACLIGILVPVVQSARTKARGVRCIANLQQLYKGLHLYANDHLGRLPFAQEKNAAGETTRNLGFMDFGPQLRPYMNTPTFGYSEPYLCPEDRENRGGVGWGYYGFSYGSNNEIGIGYNNLKNNWQQASKTFLLADANRGIIYRAEPHRNQAPRHRKGSNVIFGDGHIEWLPGNLPTSLENPAFWYPSGH